MRILFSSFIILCVLSESSHAQENLSYQLPPAEILELADYERPPSLMMDSKGEYMIFTYRPTYKSLEDLMEEEVRLAGLRVNPKTHISSRTTYSNNIRVMKAGSKEDVQVSGLPDHPRLSNFQWSPDERKLAFTHTTIDGVELWMLLPEKSQAKRIIGPVLNASMGTPFDWFNDSESLLLRTLPATRPDWIDNEQSVPDGPIVSEGDGSVSQTRTYQDLLSNPIDERNFENLATAELQKVALNGSMEPFLKADLYWQTSFSPDGRYLMVTTLSRPFSYIVPFYRFPQTTTVYDMRGRVVKVVNEVPLSEVMPKGFSSVREGKRSMTWRNDEPAQLFFAEALDEGDMAKDVPFRDELYLWDAPFNGEPVPVMKTKQRFQNVLWGSDQLAVVSDFWYDTRNTITYFFNPSNAEELPREVFERNYQDVYADPGSFEMKRNEWGRYVLFIEDNQAYLTGAGHTPEGQFPFLDALNLETLETNRLYQSDYTDKVENLTGFYQDDRNRLLVRIQSPTEFPNYFVRHLEDGSLKQLTYYENPFEALNNVHKEVINYQRVDGVELSGTLYLPADYKPESGEKLPLLIWAYPREYKDKSTAGQSTQNPNTFTYPYYGSFVYWVTRGYAVLDNAAFPIVGEGETEPNDTFIEQLVWNAEAAINAVDDMGFIDPSRVGVGGHSYGAFMTANLLTHSNLFACGIARSGAYNRTLTPFGFQSEQRNYWDAPEIYHTMSPFMNAHKMKIPMLLTHGEADNNPGTFTLQTERYFQALKNLGAPVRMVILPKESHGYVAKPNIMHLLWEQDRFLEQHLKKTGITE
ncbi:MAG: S9 family peptidase [Cryomorphaceae bacterium]|nr:MAG: S9 family peptidase [Cryomorphaceae bacterium]